MSVANELLIQHEKTIMYNLMLLTKGLNDKLEEVSLLNLMLTLEPNDFLNEANKIAFETFSNYVKSNNLIPDFISLCKILQENNKFVNIIEKQNIAGAMDFFISSGNEYSKTNKIKSVVKSFLDRKSKNLLMTASENAKRQLTTGANDLPSIIEGLSQSLNEAQKYNKTTTVAKAGDVATLLINNAIFGLDNIDKFEEKNLKTYIESVDSVYNGFEPREVTIIGARPAMGKTAFALQLLINGAEHLKSKNECVMFFSLEMAKESLMQRILSNMTGIPLQVIKKPIYTNNDGRNISRLTKDDILKLKHANDHINSLNIFISDEAYVTIPEIKNLASKKIMEGFDIKLLLIDYLQLIKGFGAKQERTQELGEISRGLKTDIAGDLNIPVVALAQVSREIEKRQDKRPTLSDLRESGSIEQDADTVAFLYRDDYYNEESTMPGVTEVIIGKQRNGSVGTAYVKFTPETQTFESYLHTNEDTDKRPEKKPKN